MLTRAAVKMENRFKIERKDLKDKMLDAIRRSQQQPTPTPALTSTPVRRDPYEPVANQPGTYQPTTPTNDSQSDAQYKTGLHQTLANYSQLLEFCRANPGTTPEEQAATDSLVQTILQSRAYILHSLQKLESQGR